MFNDKSPNVEWHESQVSREERLELLGQDNKVLWFTGLPSSGKSTIAHALEKELNDEGILTFVLDGDNVRHGLNSDLGFSPEDRRENIRRVAEVAKLFYDSGVFTMASFVSPYQEVRDNVRGLIGEDFVEIYVKCSVEECARRDEKGLYERARQGEIENFTGVNAPYEEPESPELVLDTENLEVEECVGKVLDHLDL